MKKFLLLIVLSLYIQASVLTADQDHTSIKKAHVPRSNFYRNTACLSAAVYTAYVAWLASWAGRVEVDYWGRTEYPPFQPILLAGFIPVLLSIKTGHDFDTLLHNAHQQLAHREEE